MFEEAMWLAHSKGRFFPSHHQTFVPCAKTVMLLQVRLSNMARVFGADGILDATAIEMRVRKAQQERHAAHEDRNAARKLTTSERKAKQLRKMFDEGACDVHVQVWLFFR